MKSYGVILNCEYTELPSLVNFPCAADGVLIKETYRVVLSFLFLFIYFLIIFFCDHVDTLISMSPPKCAISANLFLSLTCCGVYAIIKDMFMKYFTGGT